MRERNSGRLVIVKANGDHLRCGRDAQVLGMTKEVGRFRMTPQPQVTAHRIDVDVIDRRTQINLLRKNETTARLPTWSCQPVSLSAILETVPHPPTLHTYFNKSTHLHKLQCVVRLALVDYDAFVIYSSNEYISFD